MNPSDYWTREEVETTLRKTSHRARAHRELRAWLWSALGWLDRHPDRDRITRADVEGPTSLALVR